MLAEIRSRTEIRKDLVTKILNFRKENDELYLDPIKIRIVLQLYKDWKSCFVTARTSEFARGVLYYIAERMYWSRFTESQEVVTLLQFILETDKDLLAIMYPDEVTIRSVTVELTSNFVLYFLNHAYSQYAIFDGFRMTVTPVLFSLTWEWPITVADYMPDPSLLHEILRYGGSTPIYDGEHPATTLFHRINRLQDINYAELSLMLTLKSILKLNPNLVRFQEIASSPMELESYHKLLTCCSLLMKDLPQMDVKQLSWIQFDTEIMCNMDGHDFARKFGENVLEGFEKHFITPLDLKHLCRLEIRRNLNANYRLPRGIYGLQIPKSLQGYLDLY